MFGAILGGIASSIFGRLGRQRTSAPGATSMPAQPSIVMQREQEEPSFGELVREATKTSAATAIGSSLGNKLTNLISNPVRRGRQAGEAHRAFWQSAYPGNTPWDALGGSATSAAGSTTSVDKTNQSNEKIARINANAKIKSAEIAARGVPSVIARTVAQTRTEGEREKFVRSQTNVSKLDEKRKNIELKYLDRLKQADLTYQQSRNLLQQWRQATGDVMTDRQVSLIAAAAQTVGGAAVVGYVVKQLAKKVPVVRIMKGIIHLIPKAMRKKFESNVKRLRKKEYPY